MLFLGGESAVSYWSSYPLRCVYRGQGIKLWCGELNAFSFKFLIDLDHACKVWAAPECISPCLKEEGKEEEQEPVNIKHWENWETRKWMSEYQKRTIFISCVQHQYNHSAKCKALVSLSLSHSLDVILDNYNSSKVFILKWESVWSQMKSLRG